MDENEVVEGEEITEEEVEEEVEEAATDEDAEEEGQDEEEEDEEEEKPEPPKKQEKSLPKGVQKRIDKITRQKYEAERQIQELQQQLAQRSEAPVNKEKPTLEQFEYDDAAYIEALTDWKVQKALEMTQAQNAEKQRRSQQEQVYQDFESRRQSTNIKGVTAYDDFEDVVLDNYDLTITPQMADIITDSEIGHDIAYYLGSNTSEADNIAKMPPLKQAAAIAKLETKLASKPQKKISKAPNPIKAVGAKGTTSTKLDPSKDLKKWMEMRNKEEYGK